MAKNLGIVCAFFCVHFHPQYFDLFCPMGGGWEGSKIEKAARVESFCSKKKVTFFVVLEKKRKG